MKDRRTYESVRREFTADELRGLGEELARETSSMLDLEKKRAARSSELAGQIKAAGARCATIAAEINNGYRIEQLECIISYNDPCEGRKRYVRVDNGDVIRECDMDALERQRDLFE